MDTDCCVEFLAVDDVVLIRKYSSLSFVFAVGTDGDGDDGSDDYGDDYGDDDGATGTEHPAQDVFGVG